MTGWINIARKPDKPKDKKEVLLAVDKKVVPGFWNEYRQLWFCGERPVFPSHWREMPTLPRGLK